MSGVNSPTERGEQLKTLREGLVKEFPLGTEVLTIKGVSVRVSDLVMRIDKLTPVFQEVKDAHLSLARKIDARDAAEPQVDLLLEDARVGVTAAFGPTDKRLKEFGFPVKHPARELTVEQRVEKNKKLKLTRTLRHTMGSRQKRSIKAGNLPPAPSNGASQPPTPPNGEATK